MSMSFDKNVKAKIKNKRVEKISTLLAALFVLGGASPLLAATLNPAECDAALEFRNAPPREISFGDLMEYGSGTVTITPAGSRSATGSVVLLGGTPQAERFRIRLNISNQDVCPYDLCISVPDSTIDEGGGDQMTITNFVTSPAFPYSGLTTRGNLDINIGGDLLVNSGQTAADYSGNFNVTFSYQICP